MDKQAAHVNIMADRIIKILDAADLTKLQKLEVIATVKNRLKLPPPIQKSGLYKEY